MFTFNNKDNNATDMAQHISVMRKFYIRKHPRKYTFWRFSGA